MIKAKREKFGKFRRHLSVPTLFQADRIRDTFGDTNVRPNALKNTTDYNKRFTFSTLSLREPSINERLHSVSGTPALDKSSLFWDSFPLARNEQFDSSSSLYKRSSHGSARLNEENSIMTQAYSVSRGPADPDGSAGAPQVTKNFENTEVIHTSRSSKARQKKFHRHFKQVDIEEKVLNYYSCALIGDILLQGHLYITENFFAFYSNVFGYVTKLLIPTVEVLKISKEKTAKIIPNAVGISTEDEKHVFGSLLSRDSTYKFMLQVWKAANSSQPVVRITPPEAIKPEPSDDDSTVSSGNEEPSSFISNLTTRPSSENLQKLLPSIKRRSLLMMETKRMNQQCSSFKVTTASILIVALFAFMFASAGYLLYRIALIQSHFTDLSFSTNSDIYEDILKWQSTIHSKSANKIQEFLSMNLNQITKIRLSLEALTTLMQPKSNESEKSTDHPTWANVKLKDTNDDVTVEEKSNNNSQS